MRILPIAFLSLLATASPVATAPADAGSWTLQDCVRFALDHNPEILSARQMTEASRQRIRLAATIPQPSLELDYDLQPKPFQLAQAGESYVGVSQAIDFPLKTIVRGRIAAREKSETAAEEDRIVREVVFLVRESFFQCVKSREINRLSRENLELTREFLNKTELRMEAGDAARVEVLRAQVEVTRAILEAKRAADEEKASHIRLNATMGRRDPSPLEIRGEFDPGPLQESLPQYLQRGLTSRPELRGIHAAVDRERLRQLEGRLGYLPDFTLGVSRHRIRGEVSTWDVTLSATLPIFAWQPAAAANEARANRRAREKEREALENRIRQEIEEAYIQAESAWKQVELFERDILGQSREIHGLFLESYQEGEIGGIDLIEARRSLNQVHSAHIEALYELAVARAMLERATGAFPTE